ncbi:MAG: hypothetical protein D8M58_13745 [Calditrichaeota bacterium]|nr:MAG: hypothetical protein DWQ03_14985 [Calditrichota bacterium]MBL1206463.1 hypothetical protein [Calditrichota bacterium]NOG46290.1 hypothetical protein [Calditrichota bacterium]
MKLKLFVMVVLFTMLNACQTEDQQTSAEGLSPNMHKVVVQEIVNGKTYMYLKVKENDQKNWIATSPKDVKEGQVIYYASAMEMRDFTSKEVNRTFDKIYFVNKISDSPALSSTGTSMGSAHGRSTTPQLEDISVSPAKGGITIEQLFSKKDDYANSKIIIKGQVVKFNAQIMGKNWVHLQDGTKDGKNNDITITTNEVVSVGDIVIFEGKVILNKDFGAGYSYDVILEEGVLKVGI